MKKNLFYNRRYKWMSFLKIELAFLFFTTFIFSTLKSFSQPNMLPEGNYFDKKNQIEQYIDSSIKSRQALNLPNTGLGIGTYKRWLDFWKFYMPESGDFEEAKLIYNRDLQQRKFEHFSKLAKQNNQDKSVDVTPTAFEEIGPKSFSNFFGAKENGTWVNLDNQQNPNRIDCHLGLVHSIYQHPIEDDVVFAIAGEKNTNGGGLFKSTDGGYTWNILNTDQIPGSEIISFDIKAKLEYPHPEVEIMFIALAKGAVYRSIDGGLTWLEAGYHGVSPYPIVFNPSNPNLPSSLPYGGYFFYSSVNEPKIRKLIFTPNNNVINNKCRLVITFENEIYYTDTPYGQITPDFNNFSLQNDILWYKFDTENIKNEMVQNYPIAPGATNSKIVFGDFEYAWFGTQIRYFVQAFRYDYYLDQDDNVIIPQNGIRQFILSSTDYGVSWQFLGSPADINNPNGTYVGIYDNRVANFGNLEVRNHEPNYLYISNTTPDISSQITGSSSYLLHRYDFNTTINNWADLTNINVQSGGIATVPQGFSIDVNNDDNYWFYTNSYHIRTNGVLTDYFPEYGKKYHADVRDFLKLRNGEILIGTDGGIFRSTDDGHNFKTSSEGLNAVQSYNMAVAQKPPFYVASGFWHGGFNIYKPKPGTDGEWHNSIIGDGQGGEIFFLNNEIFTALDAGSNARKMFTFDDLSGGGYIEYYNDGERVIGKTKSSENKLGRVYAVRRYNFGTNNTGNRDAIVYSNDDLATFEELLLPTSISLPLAQSTPYVIPNEPDLLVVTSLKRLYVISGMNQVNPVPNLLYTLDLDNYTGPNAPLGGSFNKVVFDSRRNGICYLIVRSYATWNEIDKRNRIYEYNYLTNQLTNITFKTNDEINSNTVTDEIPKWYYLNDIELDRQTGILYLSTTHGIYYLDRAEERWKKYDINVPVFGSLMGIIHCTGDIYLSTQARGIWKGSLIRNEQTPTLEWKINSTQTWSDRTNLFCNLIIEPGVTLTLTGSIVVYGKQKIFVKPGGKLILDGGTITSECGDFWQGIEVWGTSSLAQNGVNQGTVVLKNGATIENAREAVRVWKEDDWSSGGGIIDASNSFFKNNWRSVEYMPYHSYTSAGVEIKNKGKFVNCAFTWDDKYYGDEAEAGITMYHVNGVVISGCDFIDNRSSSVTIDKRPDGIGTIDAGYKVLGTYLIDYISVDQEPYYSELNYDVCYFKNLKNGVYAMNSNSQSSITVDHCKFEDMVNGVVVRAMDNVVLTRNKFDFTHNHPANLSAMIGIGLVSATGFMVEGNRFLNQLESTGTAGCFASNTGSAQNQIYRNLYSDLNTGNVAYGLNTNDQAGTQLASGLQFLCNSYTGALQLDQYIISNSKVNSDGQGIRLRQGSVFSSASNSFSILDPNDPITFNIKSTDMDLIRYFYHNDPNQFPAKLDGNIACYGLLSSGKNQCVSSFNNIRVGMPRLLPPSMRSQVEEELVEVNRIYLEKKQELELLLSTFDTPVIHNLVANVTPLNNALVKSVLLEHSPYLSETLLIELGEKSPQLFPLAWYKEIITANIEVAQNQSFWSYLLHKNNPLTTNLMDLLSIERKTNMTARGEKINELMDLLTQKTQLLNLLIQDEYSDTIAINWSNIKDLLEIRNDTIHRSQLIDLYLASSNRDSCEDQLAYLDQNMQQYTEAEIQQQMTDYSAFKHYVLSFVNEQGIIEEIDETQKQQLEYMADNFKGKGAVQARNLVCFFFDLCEEFPPTVEPSRGVSEITSFPANKPSENLNVNLKVIPNPNIGEFSIETAESCEIIQINITDIEGRIISHQVLAETNSSKSIKVDNAPRGLYFVKAICTDGTSFVSRVLIK